jgi:hypothetical protein
MMVLFAWVWHIAGQCILDAFNKANAAAKDNDDHLID